MKNVFLTIGAVILVAIIACGIVVISSVMMKTSDSDSDPDGDGVAQTAIEDIYSEED